MKPRAAGLLPDILSDSNRARVDPPPAGAPPLRVSHTPGIVIVADANTTIAYCRYTPAGEIEYIFVHPAFRRRGHARALLKQVEAHVQGLLRFQSPISPLGQALVRSYTAGQPIIYPD